MRQHHRIEERRSAAAVRKAQQPRKATRTHAMTPERAAMMECANTIRHMRMHGQIVPDELQRRYRALLDAHQATLA